MQSTQFRIYNRLVATKPLGFLVNLLNMGGEIAAGVRPPAASKPSIEGGDDVADAYLNISTATNRGVLGIRLGSYFDAAQHIFIVDSAVEYRFDRNLFAFRDDEVETFIGTVAAPRIAIATWTILEEAAATVQYRLPGKMAIPPEAIADSVLNTYRARVKSKGSAEPPTG
ncbi:hypothetical protein [Mycobacteroides abscessus]|uniref:hypothetical protein n=1 Tax=Mycobacteroides abscessus TaxID=36809 RepID=UPI000268289D|nr:hypothetical protein [Mycobacteroides abscessus]EIU62517.1 hypothetical protein MM1S1510930_2854 [Mycobacteroides abscessus subsp. bolletii 1S-151-0930]MDB2203206.1 hypothetical protein [Mycobacteroides abscessus subsp. massiliense]